MQGDTSGSLLGYFPHNQRYGADTDIALIGDHGGPSLSFVFAEVIIGWIFHILAYLGAISQVASTLSKRIIEMTKQGNEEKLK